MNTSLKILVFILAAIGIAAAGVGAGYFLNKSEAQIQSPAPTALNPAAAESSAPTASNATVYDVSPPSRGPAITKIPVDIIPQDNAADVTIPAANADEIDVGQRVLLYSSDGSLKEILGAVASKSSGADGSILAKITLNGDNAVSSNDVVRGDIITSSSNMAQRLPLSAIVTDEDGNPYIWEALGGKESEQITLRYAKANILFSTYDFVVIDQPDSVSNVFVLNPDKKLKDGQLVKVRRMLFSAPQQTDDVRIASAVEYRNPRTPGDPYKGEIITECSQYAASQTENATAGSGCPTPTVTPVTGCGSSGDVLQDFIQKIRGQGPAPSAPAS